jgi:hypothetical protein
MQVPEMVHSSPQSVRQSIYRCRGLVYRDGERESFAYMLIAKSHGRGSKQLYLSVNTQLGHLEPHNGQ